MARMFNRMFSALLLSMIFTVVNSAPLGGISDVISAISKGNSKDLALHMADNMELSLPEKDGMYSKTQAEQIMGNFFRQFPAQAFKVTHQSSGNDAFFIGLYESAKGKFRVTGYFKNTATGVRVHSLKFEKS